MSSSTPKDLMREAMAMGNPARVPTMCQLAIGHTLLQSGVHPVDFFLASETYADALLKVRERYRFDGVLLHKPGRDAALVDLARRVDREGAVPTLYLEDGAKIECRRDDDPYYVPADTFRFPSTIREVDPDDPLGWAPESYVRWCAHKGTAHLRSASDIPESWKEAIRRVQAKAGREYSIHGEIRSPLDHLAAVMGLQEGLMALLTEPDHALALLETFTEMSLAWAIAQVEEGCDAIKLSSPYAGAGFISRKMYLKWVLPFERRIARTVRQQGAFIYTHTCGAIGDRLDLLGETEVNGVEALDPPPLGTVELAGAKHALQDKLFIKGNVNPIETLLNMEFQEVRADIERVCATGRQGGQFILSSACSIAPRTPAKNVEQFAECVFSQADR